LDRRGESVCGRSCDSNDIAGRRAIRACWPAARGYAARDDDRDPVPAPVASRCKDCSVVCPWPTPQVTPGSRETAAQTVAGKTGAGQWLPGPGEPGSMVGRADAPQAGPPYQVQGCTATRRGRHTTYPLALFTGSGLQRDWLAAFYEAGARAAPKVSGLSVSHPSVGGRPAFRLDYADAGTPQTIVVWPAGEGTVHVVLAAGVPDWIVQEAIAAFG